MEGAGSGKIDFGASKMSKPDANDNIPTQVLLDMETANI